MRLLFTLLILWILSGNISGLHAQTSAQETGVFLEGHNRFGIGMSLAATENSFYSFPGFMRINSRVSLRFSPLKEHDAIFFFNPFVESFPTNWFTETNNNVFAEMSRFNFGLAYFYKVDIHSRDWTFLAGGQIETLILRIDPSDAYDPAVDGELLLGGNAWLWNYDALACIRYTLPRFPLELDLRTGVSLQENLRFLETRTRSFKLASPMLAARFTFGRLP